MIEVSLEGLDEVVEALKAIPTSIDRRTIYEGVASRFASRLRSATPKGYSRNLRDSVVFDSSEDEAEVGYEPGVETAGDSTYDSVLKGKTKGRSVLRRWVKPEELESVLQETFTGFEREGVDFMTARFAEEVNRGIS